MMKCPICGGEVEVKGKVTKYFVSITNIKEYKKRISRLEARNKQLRKRCEKLQQEL